jgi:hypothetical protein
LRRVINTDSGFATPQSASSTAFTTLKTAVLISMAAARPAHGDPEEAGLAAEQASRENPVSSCVLLLSVVAAFTE